MARNQSSEYFAKLDWTLTGKELQDSLRLEYPSNIEGPTKKIGDTEIYLIWYPKGSGSSTKGYPKLSVGVGFRSALNCKWSIHCPELLMQNTYTNRFDPHKTSNWGWGEPKCVEPSRVKPLTQISFHVTLTIKQVYDENNNILPNDKWARYLGIKKKNDTPKYNKSLSEIISQLQNEINELRCYVFEEKKNNDDNGPNITNITSELLLYRQQIKILTQKVDRINNKKNENNEKVSRKKVLRRWLKESVHLEEYFDLLVDNGFDDLDSIKIITMNELNELGMQKLGHKMKLLKEIQKLNEKNKIVEYQEGATAYI